MYYDDNDHLSVSIRRLLETIPASLAIDAMRLVEELRTEFPDLSTKALGDAIRQHCRALNRICR